MCLSACGDDAEFDTLSMLNHSYSAATGWRAHPDTQIQTKKDKNTHPFLHKHTHKNIALSASAMLQWFPGLLCISDLT